MRPKKKVLIYHPDKDTAALLRYAMQVTLPANVFTVSSPAKLTDPGGHIEVTVLWKKAMIEIRNPHAKTFRTLPIHATNYELMEGVRVGLARKSYARKEREEKRAAVLVTRVREVVTEIQGIERMMSLACPKRKRYAA